MFLLLVIIKLQFDTFQPELSEVKITYDSESDRICFYGRLTLSEGQYDILSEGNVYKNVKTENAKTCTSQQKLDTNFKYYLSINLISVQYGASFATFLSG